MKILVLAQRRAEVSLEQMRPHFKSEVEAVWRLYTQGIVREFYTRADNGGPAILTVESETVESAKKILAELPLVELKMIDLDLIPLAPFNGLTHLFEPAVLEAGD
ncbi:MAG TPA: hypothetical protein VK249_26900 [Anaerolineales bacterium]|nr:hypothetical protein [Anaerolineales bacterium]